MPIGPVFRQPILISYCIDFKRLCAAELTTDPVYSIINSLKLSVFVYSRVKSQQVSKALQQPALLVHMLVLWKGHCCFLVFGAAGFGLYSVSRLFQRLIHLVKQLELLAVV